MSSNDGKSTSKPSKSSKLKIGSLELHVGVKEDTNKNSKSNIVNTKTAQAADSEKDSVKVAPKAAAKPKPSGVIIENDTSNESKNSAAKTTGTQSRPQSASLSILLRNLGNTNQSQQSTSANNSNVDTKYPAKTGTPNISQENKNPTVEPTDNSKSKVADMMKAANAGQFNRSTASSNGASPNPLIARLNQRQNAGGLVQNGRQSNGHTAIIQSLLSASGGTGGSPNPAPTKKWQRKSNVTSKRTYGHVRGTVDLHNDVFVQFKPKKSGLLGPSKTNSLLSNMPPVEDQLDLGACGSFTTTTLVEYDLMNSDTSPIKQKSKAVHYTAWNKPADPVATPAKAAEPKAADTKGDVKSDTKTKAGSDSKKSDKSDKSDKSNTKSAGELKTEKRLASAAKSQAAKDKALKKVSASLADSSELFLYFNARALQGTTGTDSGSTLKDNLIAVS